LALSYATTMTSQQVPESVCPESTIESAAAMRNHLTSKNRINGNGDKLACEYTIESSNRRDFVRRAAVPGAAVAVGSTLLGSKIIPESSARSCISSSKGSHSGPASPDSFKRRCPTGTAIYGRYMFRDRCGRTRGMWTGRVWIFEKWTRRDWNCLRWCRCRRYWSYQGCWVQLL
jgi:hypothetical protein